MGEKVQGMVQPKLARFLKRPSELSPRDLEIATVQDLRSKHSKAEKPSEPHGEPARSVLAPLETLAQAMLDVAAELSLNVSGRPTMPEALRLGASGVVNKSNRAEAGLPRRWHDITPWGGLAIVKFIEQERRKRADEV